MNQVQLAKQFAVTAHCNQQYGVNQPYTYHLQKVVDVLELELEQGHNEELMAAGWLHDVLEDTVTTPADLVSMGFSPYTIALVDAVTDRPGKNRAARHVLTYPRIRRVPEAVGLKLADRIANVRNCSFVKKGLMAMYISEHEEFSDALREHGWWTKGWDILDELIYGR